MTTSGSEIESQLTEARLAQREWDRTPLSQRLSRVRAFRHLLVVEADRLRGAVAEDVGKAPEETLGGDILPLADACRFLEKEASRLLRPRHVSSWRHRPLWLWGQQDTVYRRPRGVVGIIGTWNYPLLLNGVQILQALTAGNAVLWKPSELAPRSAEVLLDLLLGAGFPSRLIQGLPASREAGAELIEASIDHLVFTGGVHTGRVIARRLGERLISSTLELSGCDAQFVLADADVELAARAAWFGTTVNRGQTCIAVRRAFVQRSLYPTFRACLEKRVAEAPPLPLLLPAQVEQALRLAASAQEQGASLLGGESKGAVEARNCPPLVLADVRPEMDLCREASFAPILALIPFAGVDEALGMEEQCRFALGASIFTRDLAQATDLARRLRAGVVTVNDVIVPSAHPATPFGGRGSSGWGVTQGAEGLLEMTVPQVVSTRGGRFRPHYELAAGGEPAKQGELLEALLESGHAPTWRQRCRGWWHLLRAAWRFPK
jgi:acyl-CoA reductase-like NAD-dependent aldehyde dehydrogenase